MVRNFVDEGHFIVQLVRGESMSLSLQTPNLMLSTPKIISVLRNKINYLVYTCNLQSGSGAGYSGEIIQASFNIADHGFAWLNPRICDLLFL